MKKCNYMEFEKFHKDLRKGFKPHTEIKVNPSEVSLLRLVAHEPNMPFRFYGRMLKLEKSSFSYLVELVEHKDLVIISDDPKDRRRKSLKLTKKGEDLVEDLKKEFDEYLDKRFEVFSKEDKEDLEKACETITRLNKILEDSRPERPLLRFDKPEDFPRDKDHPKNRKHPKH